MYVIKKVTSDIGLDNLLTAYSKDHISMNTIPFIDSFYNVTSPIVIHFGNLGCKVVPKH